MEVDICCISDGILTIGEAKKDDRLGKSAKEENETIAKYYQLASAIGATRVVFATYANSWREVTVQRVHSVFVDPFIKVILLGRSDLKLD